MESSTIKLGGSLKVPSVQELANQKLLSVPPRYVRPDQDPPFVPFNSSARREIPVVDLQKLLADDDSSSSELHKLDSACKEWGFFQLINHGVSTSLIEEVKIEMEKFFHLPKEEKEKFGQAADDLEGFGQAFVVSEEQKLDWADMFYVVSLPTNLRKPHLLPKLPVAFREHLEVYSYEVKTLAMKILSLMAEALGMKLEDMTTLFEEGMQGIRMNHYPPCPQPEQVIGLCPHSDAVGLTILLQVSQVEGLQVKKDGTWIPVQPLPNAFVVNIGDILEIVTNGIYKSIEHRATVSSDMERISVATFLSPDLKGDMGPAPSLISPKNPAKFKRIGAADYFRELFTRELDGKSYLDVMRI